MDDADRQRYLQLLAEAAARNQCSIHAFVLMTNHVHLLATPADEESMSRMMKRLGERYVRYFNRLHRRTGTLWEGRFYSSIVQSEKYYFTCQRYIEHNPVRAGMVRRPEQYPWSSCTTNATGSPFGLITPHSLYLSLGPDAETRAQAYRSLLRPTNENDNEVIRTAANGGFAVGDAAFVKRLEAETGIPAARRKRGRPRKVDHENENGADLFRPAGKSGLSLFK